MHKRIGELFMNDLIIKNDEPYISSMLIAKRTGIDPRSTYRLINRYKKEIEDLGVLRFEITKVNSGRPLKYFLLNEEQSVFVLTLSKNTKHVVELKKNLSQQFVAYRRLTIQKLETRQNGKQQRRELTDEIKKLIDRAKQYGSKNSNKYYTIITNLIYRKLFNINQIPNKFRDSLDKRSLDKLQIVELQVSSWIFDGLVFCTDYHDIYKEIKVKLPSFIAIIGNIDLKHHLTHGLN